MKKIKNLISIFLSVVMLFSITAGLDFSAYAEEELMNDSFRYYAYDDGTADILEYTGQSESVVVPSTIDGYTVKSVVSGAFYASLVTDVTISEGIEKIGSAFSDCQNLTYVSIPSSVTTIEMMMFWECRGLENIDVDPNNNAYTSIDGVLFDKNINTLIQYPSGNSRTSYTIPYTVSYLRDFSMAFASNLETLTINSDLSVEGPSTFFECTGLKKVVFEGVSVIPSNLLSGLNIESVELPIGLVAIHDGAFAGCSSLSQITIPYTVNYIGTYNDPEFGSPEYGEYPGYSMGVFEGCTSLTEITIPNSVTYIASNAFSGCTSLNDIYYFKSKSTWNSFGIYLEPNTTVHFPEFEYEHNWDGSLTLVGYNGDARDVVIPAFTPDAISVSGIAQRDDFSGNVFENVRSITIPHTINSIGTQNDEFSYRNNSILAGCPTLEEIIVDENNSYYSSQDGVLYNKDKTVLLQYPANKSDTSFTIPFGVQTIAENAFENVANLTSLNVPGSVTNICYNAFLNCSSLTNVILGGSKSQWDYISSSVFGENVSISFPEFEYFPYDDGKTCFITGYNGDGGDVVIPAYIDGYEVTEIYCYDGNVNESGLFEGKCVTSVSIPASVKLIGSTVFNNCDTLENIYVDENNEYFASIDGVLFYKWDLNLDLFKYPAGRITMDYIIPYGVGSIYGNAFQNANNLMSIIVPNTLFGIGESAFNNCNNISTVYYMGSEEEWNYSELRYCSAFSNATIVFDYECPHIFVQEETVSPTCTEQGYTVYRCTNCYYSYHTDFTEELGHNYEFSSTVLPNCTERGYDIYICSRCESSENRNYVDALDHYVTIYTPVDRVNHQGACEREGCTVVLTESHNLVDNVCSVCGYVQYDTAAYDKAANIALTILNDTGYSGKYTYESRQAYEGAVLPNIKELFNSQEDVDLATAAILSARGLLVITYELFEYSVIDDQVHIYRYNGDGGAVVIPETIDGYPVVYVEEYFDRDYLLDITSITIPSAVQQIGPFYDNNPFSSLDKLEYINVDGNNEFYKSVDGVLYNKSMTQLFTYPAQKKDEVFEIPNGVRDISDCAFSHTQFLKKLIISQTVSLIFNTAFFNCDSLTDIEVDEKNGSFTSINGVLFDKYTNALYKYPSAKSAEEYTIPGNVDFLFEKSFNNSTNLRSITIPESIYYIPSDIFTGCMNLTDVYYVGTEEQWNDVSVDDTTIQKATIHFVPLCTHENVEITVIQPTCTTGGYTIKTCLDCGYETTYDATVKLGHEYLFDSTVLPTCSSMGYDKYVCSRCDSTQNRNYVSSLEHTVLSYELHSIYDHRGFCEVCKTDVYAEHILVDKVCAVCGYTPADTTAYDDAVAEAYEIMGADDYSTKYLAGSRNDYENAVYNAMRSEFLTQQEADSAASAIICAKTLLIYSSSTVDFYIVNENGNVINHIFETVNYGDTLTLNADEFISDSDIITKWIAKTSSSNYESKVATSQRSYTMVVTRPVEIYAHYVTVSTEPTVKYSRITFIGKNGSIIEVKYVREGVTLDTSTVVAPEIPFYQFTGWNKASVTANGSDIFVKANYRFIATDENKCKVHYNSVVHSYAYDSFVYIYGAEDKKLALSKDGTISGIITFLDENAFYAPHCSDIYVIEVEEMNSSIGITGSYSYDTDENKMVAFNCKAYLPEGFTLVECGLIASSVNGSMKVRANTISPRGEYCIKLQLDKNTQITAVQGKAYMVFKNASGDLVTIESDEITQSL